MLVTVSRSNGLKYKSNESLGRNIKIILAESRNHHKISINHWRIELKTYKFKRY